MSTSTHSKWIKCISTHGNVRGVAIEARKLVQEVSDLHGLSEAGIRSLGEAMIGSLLIASYCKGKERINLNIRASGNIFQALVDAHPDGTVRGYVIEQEPKSLNSEYGPWGEGLLSVLRTQQDSGEQPYIGTVPLVTGHLAKDLTFYWVQSEQIPSAVGLVVTVKDGKVASAGGFLVQALPGASPAEIRMIEEHIQEIQSLVGAFADNPEPMKILSQIFQSTAFVVLEEKPLAFQCDCSWERVNRALKLVGAAELRSMLAEDHEASVRCDFCVKEYRLGAEQLEALIDSTSTPTQS